MEIIKGSIVISGIKGLWSFLAAAWEHSLIFRAGEVLRGAFEQSKFKRLSDDFGRREDMAEYSLWAIFLLRAEALLLKTGGLLRQSLFYKLMVFPRSLYEKLSKGSIVLGAAGKLSLKRWILLAFAAYLPLEYIIRDRLGLGFLASAWEELFIIAALFLVLWRCALGQSKSFSRASSVEVAILLLMSVDLLLMFLTAVRLDVAVAGYRAQVEYMIWFSIMLRLLETVEDARFLIKAFAAVVALLCVHGCYQFAIGVPIPAGWTSSTEMAVRTRVFSITGSPNIFGSLIIFAIPIVAALVYYEKKPLRKFLLFGVLGMMCLCDLFTFSRGSWVGLIVAMTLFAVLVDGRLIAAMLAAMGGVLVAVPSIADRIAYLFTRDYLEASAAGGRSIRWETGMELLKSRSQWLGYGLGRFGGAVAMNNRTDGDIEYFYLDNYYLKTLVESGYIGLIFFLLLLAFLAVYGLKAMLKAGSGERPDRSADPLLRRVGSDSLLCAGLLCGLCGIAVHCLFENIFEEPYMMAYFWGLAAAMIVLPKAASETEKVLR